MARLRLTRIRSAGCVDRAARPNRSGITLLEVLISIGVVSIGLLGVAALIPVAQFKAAQGILEDRKAVFGRHAVREFRIRGMNSSGTAANPNWLGPPNWQAGNNGLVFGANGNLFRPLKPYCLDPLLIARALEGGIDPSQVRTFPYSGHTAAKMLRITLRASPAPDPATPVTSLLADEMFRLPDDLVFQIPRSRPELPPLRQYLISAAGPQKALAEGNLSWMATIVPTINLAGDTDTYTLSVVIFNKRLLDPTEEVVAEVTDIEGTLGQGEIILADELDLSPAPKYRIKDIRVGDWLMLSQVVKPDPRDQQLQSMKPQQVFRWTRVINADENNDVPGVNREFTVSLSGMDARGTANPHAVWVKGVVAVYEKTIRLENSTLWN